MIIIKTTTDTIKNAKFITDYLLKNKLVACANLIKNVQSLFVWNNKISKLDEIIVLFKTKKGYEKKVYDVISNLHSYDVPEISTIKVSNIEKKYKNWLEETLSDKDIK